MASKPKTVTIRTENFRGIAPAIGIDLGANYCYVAVYQNGQVITIPNNEQGNSGTIASYVMYNTNGTKTIGNAAKDSAHLNPENTIYDLMRIIGKRTNDPELQRHINYWPFRVVDDEGNPKIIVHGERLNPEEVCMELLSHFRVMTATHLGLQPDEIKKAVITVPAYFNDAQRQAIKNSGELAGLEVLCLLNKPTAAIMAYSIESTTRKVLVFDLGCSDFDVALLDVSASQIEILGVNGDTYLGGEDFDQNLINYCADKFLQETTMNLMDGNIETRRGLQRLKRVCETAKKQLSSQETTIVSLDAIFSDIDFRTEVTRTTFEELNMPYFQKTIDIVDRMLRDAGIRKQDIDKIVLVGGSTRIPKVQELLVSYFEGNSLDYSTDPEIVVAYGAAVLAAKLTREYVEEHH